MCGIRDTSGTGCTYYEHAGASSNVVHSSTPGVTIQGDTALIDYSSDTYATRDIYVNSTLSRVTSNRYAEADQSVGDPSICLSAVYSGVTCGEIAAINISVYNPNTRVTTANLNCVSFAGADGDSGGPNYHPLSGTSGAALGVGVHNGSGTVAGAWRACYTPMDQVERNSGASLYRLYYN